MVFKNTEAFEKWKLERGCPTKVAFQSRNGARRHARRFPSVTYHVYACKHCGQFHLTSQADYRRR
jgi:hypothetical protein